jgi:FtsP/CotA-like multicopper oxidase with cupredoxin domain
MTTHVPVRTALLVVAAIGALALVPIVARDALTAPENSSPLSGPSRGPSSDGLREIHLVARDMTFYIAGEDTPNPTLEARPGERIRLVFSNTDVGMSHDFAIRSWRVNTKLLKGKGQASIEFTVPSTRGTHDYSCTPHAEMMGGTIVVQ